MAKGFIQLDREVFESGIFRNREPFSKREAWIDILIMVNYKDSKILVGNTLIECKAGQSILSQESWAKRWNWDRSMVRRYFELLQKSNMIIVESVQKTTRITVSNRPDVAQELHQSCTEIAQKTTMITPLKSDSYEQVRPDSDPILTNERPFVDPITDHNIISNKEIKKESNNVVVDTPEEIFEEEAPEEPESQKKEVPKFIQQQQQEFREQIEKDSLNPKIDKNKTLEILRDDLDLVNQVLRELRKNSIATEYFCLTENNIYRPTEKFKLWYNGIVEDCVIKANNKNEYPKKLGDTKIHVINFLRYQDFIKLKNQLMPTATINHHAYDRQYD